MTEETSKPDPTAGTKPAVKTESGPRGNVDRTDDARKVDAPPPHPH